MKRKLLLFILLCLTGLVSCTKDTVISNSFVGKAKTTIPVSDALDNLFSFLECIDRATKSQFVYNPKVIQDVFVISSDAIISTTRSKSGSSIDSLIYVVNFCNNEGFAVLAADTRVPDEIIAVAERGYLDPSVFADNKTNCSTKSGGMHSEDEMSIIPGLIASYLSNELPDDEEEHDTSNEEGGDDNGGPTTPWSTWQSVGPMIPFLWDQETPFNDLCPLDNNGDHKPAGCVPVAVGTIMAYLGHPTTFVCDDLHIINWANVRLVNVYDPISAHIVPGDQLAKNDVAHLISAIGSCCSAFYTPNWTFAWPANACDFLLSKGYSQAELHIGYDESLIFDMLLANKPVFIAAISGALDGHAWVIDGLLRQVNGPSTRDLMHCKFGWRGNCDGYYISHLFDTGAGYVSFDSNYENGICSEDYDFDWCFRIITY